MATAPYQKIASNVSGIRSLFYPVTSPQTYAASIRKSDDIAKYDFFSYGLTRPDKGE